MVEYKDSELDSVFRALGDSTRRQMLQLLSFGEQTVGQLAAPFSMSLAAASKHVKALEEAGLITRQVSGRTHFCSLNAAPLRTADDWLRHYERFWTARLDQLEALLRQDGASVGQARSPVQPTSRRKRSAR